MKQLAAIVVSATGASHALMAAEALKTIAKSLGHQISVEIQGTDGDQDILSAEEIAAADVVILATDIRVKMDRFVGKPVYGTTTGEAIRNTRTLIENAVELTQVNEVAALPAAPTSEAKKFVAVTSCAGGVAHTFLAAECLQKAARALGHEIKVETQGSIGAKNILTPEEIAGADAVVIAADTKVDSSRFLEKPLYFTSTKQAIHSGKEVLTTALAQPAGVLGQDNLDSEGRRGTVHVPKTGPYKHLLTGVSYMLPMLIAGGLFLALAFAFGGVHAGEQKGTFPWLLHLIGSGIAFQLFVAVFSAYIAFSIADRPGLAPGLICGMLAQHLGAGFLGGIASGYLVGYLTKFLSDRIRLPATLESLKPLLILPFLSTLLVGSAMFYAIAPPMQIILELLTGWLRSIQGVNALWFGIILGALAIVDMGGPINKAVSAFVCGMFASKIYTPMAALMAAGMVPPIGIAIAVWLFRNRFDVEERKAAGSAFVLGLSFITEGAIPYAVKDPLRVIPTIAVAGAVTGAVCMLYSVELFVPHGGIFALLIPGTVKNLTAFFAALAAGTLTMVALLFILKKPLNKNPVNDDNEQSSERGGKNLQKWIFS